MLQKKSYLLVVQKNTPCVFTFRFILSIFKKATSIFIILLIVS